MKMTVAFSNKTRAAVALAFTGVLAIGCASKPLTGIEQVQRSRERLEDTRHELRRAQNELKEFQQSLEEVQKSLNRSDDIASRERASTALNRLSLKIQEAELDLKELLDQNRAIAMDLDSRLQKAAEASREMMAGTLQPNSEVSKDRK